MPIKKDNFLYLASASYEGWTKNNVYVCKEPPISEAKEMPISGKVLHTFEMTC